MARTLNIPTRFTAKDGFSSPVARMGKNVKGFAAKTQIAVARAERSFRRLNAPIKRVTSALGGMGLFIGGTAIVGGMVSMINVFKNFEQANANLASVMSSATKPELAILKEEAKMLGATTAKTATEVVGLQEAFARLGFKQKEISSMTKATIDGSVAMNSGLAETADLVGAMVNTFTQFDSTNAPEIIDKMTLATQTSALNFEKLQTALPIVTGAANAAGLSFSETTAILGKLSDAGVDASSSATALRNIFLESEKQGLNYTEILEKISNSSGVLTASFDAFGKRGAVAGSILSGKLAEVAEQAANLENNFEGKAAEAAEKQLNTLGGALTILGSAYEGFILSLEDGNGAFAEQLKFLVKVATYMLSVASGTGDVGRELTETEKKIKSWGDTALGVLDTIGLIVKVFIAWKAVILLTKGALIAYNAIAQAVFLVNMIKYVAATQGLTFAQAALAVAQSSLNAIMAANPIGLVVIAIAALVALVVIVISKWDEWGAALSLFLGPLGMVISLIQSFRRNWDLIKQAFSEGGILSGLKMIGKTILDSILMPLQQLLEIASSLPGKLGATAAAGAAKIANFRAELGVNTEDASAEVVSTKKAQAEKISETVTTQNQNVNINVNDNTGAATVDSDNDIVPVNVSSTK